MTDYRIPQHPILSVESGKSITFFWQGQVLTAREGEMIASALFAHGIRSFGHHPKDGAPQGIFCANGQCSQCMVLADGHPVKACMTPVTPGMHVEPLDGLPTLPPAEAHPHGALVETADVPVLILGGGPAGLSAALELACHHVRVLLIDDKDRLGGKLVLQTHRFFGDINAVYAGTRGIDIATRLANAVRQFPEIDVWLNSTALAVFSDSQVGVLRAQENGSTYTLVRPQVLLVATGAREKSLVFKGNTLPGVYGAGAFQTLVNRDLVKAADRLFIVGGGNVGLIAGYHALQAGIQVVGLVEALPQCGGYKVHRDKLARAGVPIYTSHTIVSANGDDQVTSVTIAEVDKRFHILPGTERTFACDTVLIAVGLDPVNEFYEKACSYGMQVFAAGDAEEIAEASAAIFSGKIRGREIAQALGVDVEAVPAKWNLTGEILKSRPGPAGKEQIPAQEQDVFPVIHCSQKIPCNPCAAVCPQHLIHIDPDDIRAVPKFLGAHLDKACLGCEKCVTHCPGLAITLVDYRKNAGTPTVTLAYEFGDRSLEVGETVTVLDTVGTVLGDVVVTGVRALKRNDRTVLVKVQAPKEIAKHITGIRVQAPWVGAAMPEPQERLADDTIVCRCERVTAAEIRTVIQQGVRDINEIKTTTRAGMGACGGKTCTALIWRLFREENVPLNDITEGVSRPLFVEAPLSLFTGGLNAEGLRNRHQQDTAPAKAPLTQRLTSGNSNTASHNTFDAIIIGAGSLGIPAAWAMAQAGLDVLVLDQFASHGQGSNKSAIGGVRATHSDPAKIRLCLRSLEIFSTWQAKYGHDIEWMTGGYSFVAYHERERAVLQQLLLVQHGYGLDIDWYERDALLKIVPDLNPDGLLGGTFSPKDGHCSPLLAGQAFYDAAQQAGAVFHFNEPVTDILTQGRSVTGVHTPQGNFYAPVLINAAGPWAKAIGNMVNLDHPVTPEAHEAGITEPVARFLNPLIVDIHPAPGSRNYYFFQLQTGQVVFCITPDPPVPGFDRQETSVFLPLVAPRMVNLMPRLAPLRVRRTWRGLYPMTPDGSPLVGWARELDGYLIAAGMCGQGLMLGPGLGELLARMVNAGYGHTDALSTGDQEILDILSPYRVFTGEELLK